MFVSYSQVAFFNSSVQNPFNDWTMRHVGQGFAWRSGAVSFRTLVESGYADVTFELVERFSPAVGSVRSISVPFSHLHEKGVEIATITEARSLELEPGTFQLVFETGWSATERTWCRFTLILNGDLIPRILVCDPELDPEYPLLMEAKPAA